MVEGDVQQADALIETANEIQGRLKGIASEVAAKEPRNIDEARLALTIAHDICGKRSLIGLPRSLSATLIRGTLSFLTTATIDR